MHGNNVGTLVYAYQWRILENEPTDIAIVSKTFSQLCKEQPFYSSHAMRHDFQTRYNLMVDISKKMLQNTFRTLLQDSSAAEYALQAEVDEYVAKAVL